MINTTESTSAEPDRSRPRIDLSLRGFLSRWGQEILGWDGPFWRSLRQLMLSPGRLSKEQVDGTATADRPVHPVRLYLAINILFFFLAPWVNSANVSVWSVRQAGIIQAQPALEVPLRRAIERSNASDEVFLAVLDERLAAQQGALVWLLVPAIGFASFAVSRRRRCYLVEHFVFATNFVSFLLVSLLALGLTVRLVVGLVGADTPWVVLALVPIVAWLVWLFMVTYRGAKQFHGFSGPWLTTVFTAWMGVALYLGVWLYLQALFLFTLIGLRDLHFPG